MNDITWHVYVIVFDHGEAVNLVARTPTEAVKMMATFDDGDGPLYDEADIESVTCAATLDSRVGLKAVNDARAKDDTR